MTPAAAWAALAAAHAVPALVIAVLTATPPRETPMPATEPAPAHTHCDTCGKRRWCPGIPRCRYCQRERGTT